MQDQPKAECRKNLRLHAGAVFAHLPAQPLATIRSLHLSLPVIIVCTFEDLVGIGGDEARVLCPVGPVVTQCKLIET